MISPEQLRRFRLFAGLDPALYKDLAMLGERVEHGPEQWIFDEGQEADRLFFVESGKVDLFVSLDDKGERYSYISTHSDGELLGWSALVEPYCYTLGARTIDRTILVALDGPALRRFLNSNPEAGMQVMGRLAKLIGEHLTDLRVRFVSLSEQAQ